MRQLNKDDYEKIKGYEHKFNTSIKSRYYTGLTSEDIKIIGNVYKETLGKNVNSGCGDCVLNMLRQVGRMYFKFKKDMEKEKTKKRGRPKKEE